MNVSLASWLLILVALVLANLPYVNEHVFGFIPLKPAQEGGAPNKHAWVRVGELLALYLVTGAFGWLLESRMGNVFAQTREFYMITVPLFVVLGFPGFVLRYLRKRQH